jgi:hypothetical protein
MDVIEYVEKIDNIMLAVNKDYKYIYDDIHNYLYDGKITYIELMDFEVSLEDLSIQLNSLVFLFKQKQVQDIINNNRQVSSYKDANEENYNNEEKIKQYNKEVKKDKMDTKIDYIIDKTIFNILPLIFCYFMVIDKESILYLKDFVESKNNTSNNITNNINIKKEEYNNKCKTIINNIFNEEYILNDLD